MTKVAQPTGGELKKVKEKKLSKKYLSKMFEKSKMIFEDNNRTIGTFKKYCEIFHRDMAKRECYENEVYAVYLYRKKNADDMIHEDSFKGKCDYISLRRHDKKPTNNWQDMQTIKNRLLGTNCEAIQIFPAEDRMINTANQYHLIVFPEGYVIPFGFMSKRFVNTRNDHGGINAMRQDYQGE